MKKQLILLTISYLLLSIFIFLILSRTGKMKYEVTQTKAEFNDDKLFIYPPSEENIDFVLGYEEGYSIYSIEKDYSNGSLNYIYNVYSKMPFVMYNRLISRWTSFAHPKTEIKKNVLYYSGDHYNGAVDNSLVMSRIIPDEPEVAFLYKSIDKSLLIKNDVYLIVISRDSKLFNDYQIKFGQPYYSIDENGDNYVYGSAIYNSISLKVTELLKFLLIMNIVPLVLAIFLLRYTYDVFLSEMISTIKIKSIFYKTKIHLFLELAGKNLLFGLGTSIVATTLLSLIFKANIETIKYLSIVPIFFGAVIIISSYEIVAKTLKEVYKEVK